MVEGWVRGTGGLWYGWAGCMGWGKRVEVGLGCRWVGVWVGWRTGWGSGMTAGWAGIGVCTGVLGEWGEWVGLGTGNGGMIRRTSVG